MQTVGNHISKKEFYSDFVCINPVFNKFRDSAKIWSLAEKNVQKKYECGI